MKRAVLTFALVAAVSMAGACSSESNGAYKSCADAKAAGKTPLHKGDAGYSTKLDQDGDGTACEA